MHASPTLSLRLLLSPLVMAALLAAPYALAKKDLFATEPGAKQVHSAEQLAPTSSAGTDDTNNDDKVFNKAAASNDSLTSSSQAPNPETQQETLDTQKELSTHKEPSPMKESSAIKEPSVIEVQLARLKHNLTKTKNDLFGSKDSTEKKAAAVTLEPQLVENTPVEEEIKPEVATISATEAAQRAQTFAEGQVINVRKYQEENKPRYAVKLLQKNGRMKTINLDAVNGTLIEETPQ